MARFADYDGFKCRQPLCGGLSRVIRSRPWKGATRRTRECSTCGHRWATIELPVTVQLVQCADRLGISFDRQDAQDED
jgi:transcriptional regulator NrdR family protein